MWPVIVGVLSTGLAILALLGLLTVAKELLRDSSHDANFGDADAASGNDVEARACGRQRVITR
jgi:hypothetical protein